MSGTTRSRAWIGGAVTALAIFTALVATEPWLAMGWDEGYTLGREDRVRWWLQALRDPQGFASSWQPPQQELVQVNPNQPPPRANEIDARSKLLEARVLEWFWPFAREEPHGHPPFYALAGLIGDVLTPWREQLARARLGTMLIFSLAGGAIFAFLSRRFGTWAGVVAACAWTTQPRLFAEGHYATYDAILTSLWAVAVLAFAALALPDPATGAKGGRRWGIVFGVLAGLAASTKFTGCALAAPLVVWSLMRLDVRALKWLAIAGVITALVLWVGNPSWWFDPISGFERFVRSNTTRGRTINIETMYLGTIYNTPRESLPWHNTLVWTFCVVPVGFLLLAIAGIARGLKRWRSEPFGAMVILSWAFLMTLRALPHTPGHDGVRQFLPAFGLLAILAGLGAGWLMEASAGASQGWAWGRWGRVLAVAAIAEGAASVALMMPVPLSYYSPIVGGLPGANRLGMEPTYFWDALDQETLDWLNANTPEEGGVAFATNPTNWIYLRRTGAIQAKVLGCDPLIAPTWYVVQNRPGALDRDRDLPLIANGRPARVVSRWGVPLIWVFPFSELR